MFLCPVRGGLCPEGGEVGEVFIVELLQGPGVLAVGDEPVDGREMFPLGQLLFQPPEYLHNTQGCRGHGVGEVTTRRRHTVTKIYTSTFNILR